jgi:NAD(P)-dependent dehydrogenase (short-subunit alcohol dehydrogenase family)
VSLAGLGLGPALGPAASEEVHASPSVRPSVAPVERFVWRPVEAPVARHRVLLRGRSIAVVGGGDGAAERLRDALAARGARVHRFGREHGRTEEVARAFGRQAGPIDVAIDLNVGVDADGEGPFDPRDRDGWRESLRCSVRFLKMVYEDWVEETDAKRIVYMPVTRLGGLMGYEGAEIPRPLGGIWAGLAKTLPREIPNVNVRVLDLPAPRRGDEELIADELEHQGGLFEIGRVDGKRYTLASRRAPVGPERVTLGPSDTIVVSGGGRGLGFALARSLAETFGCRVVVTGRTAAPDEGDPLMRPDETAFRAHRMELLRRSASGPTVARARAEIEQLARQRELAGNLRLARERGLPLEYRACDFASLEQVRALVEALGDSVTGVVHNAGVDTPIRLPGKGVEAFLDTVRIKVDGFLNLIEVIGGRRLKLFCSVGSLTGRWGGMVGQFDYGAANEGLTRLGLWAHRSGRAPVQTLCWPTWERMGMVSNFEATLRYMAALDVDEGLEHWRRELLAGSSGEVTFMGPVGPALSPVLLRGFPLVSEVPGIARLRELSFALGDVVAWKPGQRIRTRHRVDLLSWPCAQAFLVGGAPALPVSVLLELGLAAVRWIAPEDPALQPRELRDVRVRLAPLSGPVASLEIEAEGGWDGDAFRAQVAFRLAADEVASEIGRAEVVYRGGAAPLPGAPAWPATHGSGHPLAPPVTPALRWDGQVFRRLEWERAEERDDVSRAVLDEVSPADLWTSAHAPTPTLPFAALEGLVQKACTRAGPDPVGRLLLRRLCLGRPSPRRCTVLWSRPDATGWVLDEDGACALSVEGLVGEPA